MGPQTFLSWTHPETGVTIGVTADSPGEALGVLCEQFGEGFATLYFKASNDMTAMCSEILEDGGDPELRQHLVVDPVREDHPDREVAQATDHGPGSSSGDGNPGSDRDQEIYDEAIQEGLELSNAATDGVSLASAEQPEQFLCSVCGVEITPDRAKASMLMTGEHRCNGCTA